MSSEVRYTASDVAMSLVMPSRWAFDANGHRPPAERADPDA